MLNGCFVNPSSATKLVRGVQVKATPGLAACFLKKPHFSAAVRRPRPLPVSPPLSPCKALRCATWHTAESGLH